MMIAYFPLLRFEALYTVSSEEVAKHKVKADLHYCKNIWVTSTIFWSSHAVACLLCMTNFKRVESKVEKLLLFVKLGSSCRKPS